MNSKTREEVEKRRARPSPTNIYQRLALFAGAIALVLAIWTSPRMASMRAVAVIGAILLIFFMLKDYKLKKYAGKKVHQEEITPKLDEKVGDQEEMLPSLDKKVDLQEILPNSGEKVVDLQEMLSKLEEREKTEKTV